MKTSTKRKLERLEGKAQPAVPVAKRPTRLPRFTQSLETVADARRMLATIIVQAANGTRSTSDSSRLAFMLTQFVAIIRSGELEDRVRELEQHQQGIPHDFVA